jgi:hypothetical protein
MVLEACAARPGPDSRIGFTGALHKQKDPRVAGLGA